MTQWTDQHVKQVYAFLANGELEKACIVVDNASDMPRQPFTSKDKKALAAFGDHVKNRPDLQIRLATMACGNHAARKTLASFCLKNLKDFPGDAFIPALNDMYGLVDIKPRAIAVMLKEYLALLKLAWKYPTLKLYHYCAFLIEPGNYASHSKTKKINDSFLNRLGYSNSSTAEKDGHSSENESIHVTDSFKSVIAGAIRDKHHFFAARVAECVADSLVPARTTNEALNMIAGFEEALELPNMTEFGGSLASQLVIQELGYKYEGDKDKLASLEMGLFHSNPTVCKMYFKGVAKFAPSSVISQVSFFATHLYWAYTRSESVDKQLAELERWLKVLEVFIEMTDGKHSLRDDGLSFFQGGMALFQHTPWRHDLKNHLPDLVQLIGQHIKVRGADNEYIALNVKS